MFPKVRSQADGGCRAETRFEKSQLRPRGWKWLQMAGKRGSRGQAVEEVEGERARCPRRGLGL